jgi:hypothetical protein
LFLSKYLKWSITDFNAETIARLTTRQRSGLSRIFAKAADAMAYFGYEL